jgi:hypothetical protein
MAKSTKRNRLTYKKLYCLICFKFFKIRGLLDSCEHHYCLRCIKAWAKVDETHRCPTCKKNFKRVYKKIANKIVKKNLIVNNRVSFKYKNNDYLFIYESDLDDQNYENRTIEEVMRYSLYTNHDEVPIEVLKIIFDENYGHHFGNRDSEYNDVIEKVKSVIKAEGEAKIYLQSIHFSVNKGDSYEALVGVNLSDTAYPVYIPFQKYI